MSHPSHSLPLHLWGNAWPRDSHALRRCVSLQCLWLGFAAVVSSTMTPQILSAMAAMLLPTEVWEEAACQRWKELTVTRMHIISDTFIHCVLVNTLIFTLAVFQTLLRAHTQKHRRTHTQTPVSHMHCTTLVHNSAHSLRRCWWIRHLELADKERKWGRATQRRKEEGKKRGRIWKREKGLVRQHAGRKERSRRKRSRRQKGERCGEEEEDRGAERNREAKEEDVWKRSETWEKPAVPNPILPTVKSSAGFPCCCSRIWLHIRHICLTLTWFDDLHLHMSGVMKARQGKAAVVKRFMQLLLEQNEDVGDNSWQVEVHW